MYFDDNQHGSHLQYQGKDDFESSCRLHVDSYFVEVGDYFAIVYFTRHFTTAQAMSTYETVIITYILY